jgi:FkbM family methyltransferase
MNATRLLVRMARACYRATPLAAVRRMAFKAFAHGVRLRRMVSVVHGFRFDLDLGELIDLSLFLGEYEPEVTAAIRGHARSGMTVLDVGANIGAHTLLLAGLVGTAGRVIAFEPTDYAFEKLQRNLALNDVPQVEPVKVALSDHRSGVQLVDFRSSWMTNGGRKDGVSSVRFETLDDWCRARRLARVDLIKLDVDGNEFPLLEGGREIISGSKPIFIMEAVGPHFEDDGRNPYRFLEGLGYHFRELRSGREMSVEALRALLPRNDAAMSVSLNILAIAGEKTAMAA